MDPEVRDGARSSQPCRLRRRGARRPPLSRQTEGLAAGGAIALIAYLGNQQGWLPGGDGQYPLANLIGSSLILASLYRDWNLSAAIIEAFWAMISLYGLAKRPR